MSPQPSPIEILPEKRKPIEIKDLKNISLSDTNIRMDSNWNERSKKFFHSSTPKTSQSSELDLAIESLNNFRLSDLRPLRPLGFENNSEALSFLKFKQSNKPFIKRLLANPLNFNKKDNYCLQLDLIRREQNFDVEYRFTMEYPDIDGKQKFFFVFSFDFKYYFH